MMSRPCLMIFGPQGVGKGTQAERLALALGIEHLSTGVLLRQAVRDATPLGRRVSDCLDRGDLVPDELMVGLLQAEIERLHRADTGYVLDGFPRTIDQAVAFAALVDAPIAAAIELTASLDVLLDRLLRRRVCPACDTITTAPTHVDAVACPNGDGIAIRRSDDTPTAIGHRLALYDLHTERLVAWFRGASRVITIDGEEPPDRVHAQILEALDDTRVAPVRTLRSLAVGH